MNKKRLIAILLSVAMMVTSMPMMVLAEAIQEDATTVEQTTENQQAVEQAEEGEELQGLAKDSQVVAPTVNAAPEKGPVVGANTDPSGVDADYDGNSHLVINWGTVQDTSYYRYEYYFSYKLGGKTISDYLTQDAAESAESAAGNITKKKDTGKYEIKWRLQHKTGMTWLKQETVSSGTITSYVRINLSNATVSLVDSDKTFMYNKSSQGPALKNLVINGNTVATGSHLTFSGDTAKKDVGTYYVNVEAKTNDDTFKGSKSNLEWNIESFTVQDYTKEFTYDFNKTAGADFGKGKVQKPTFTVVNPVTKNTLTEGVDYRIDYNNGSDKSTNVGTYTAKIVGIGSYSGEQDVSWKINKSNYLNIDNNIANLIKAKTLTYTGKAQDLVDDSELKKLGADISVEYKLGSNGTNPTPGFTDYVLTPQDVSGTPQATNVNYVSQSNQYYVCYKVDGGKNYNDVEYNKTGVGYKYNLAVKISPATITAVKLKEATGTMTATGTNELRLKYNGSDQSVEVVGFTANGVDYTDTSLVDISSITAQKAVTKDGYAVTVSAKDKSNFTGSKAVKWYIDKSYVINSNALEIKYTKDSKEEWSSSAASFEFTNADITPEFRVTADGVTLEKGKDYQVVAGSDTTKKNVGTGYTINIVGIGDYAPREGVANTASATWAISNINLKEATIDSAYKKNAETGVYEIVYTGKRLVPSVTKVTDTKGNELANTEYDVKYYIKGATEAQDVEITSDNTKSINVGDYRVKIIGKNNHGGTLTIDYSITKSDYIVKNIDKLIKAKTLTYTGQAQKLVDDSELLKLEGVSVEYQVSEAVVLGTEYLLNPTAAGANPTGTNVSSGLNGKYKVAYKVNGGQNYTSVSYEKTGSLYKTNLEVELGKATITAVKLKEATGTRTATGTNELRLKYNGSDQSVEVVGFTANGVDYTDTSLVDISSITAQKAVTTDGYAVTVSAKNNGNFTGSKAVKWYIDKSYVINSNALEIKYTKDSKEAWSSSEASFEFSGSDITPTIRVTADGVELTKDDYEVVAGSDTTKKNVGTGYTINIVGKGDYAPREGVANTASATWAISKTNLKEATIDSAYKKNEKTGVYEIVYTGKRLVPSVTKVIDTKSDNKLDESEYDVKYYIKGATEAQDVEITSDNTKSINVGDYRVKIIGKNNHGGTLTIDYSITKSDYIVKNIDKLITTKTLTYNGEAQKLVNDDALVELLKNSAGASVEYKISGTQAAGYMVEPETKGSNPTATNVSYGTAGKTKYNVTYKVDGGQNYEGIEYDYDTILGTKCYKSKIEVLLDTAEITDVVLQNSDGTKTGDGTNALRLTYSGSEQTVSVKSVKANGKTFDYSDTKFLATGTKAGTDVTTDGHTVTVTAIPLGNFTGSKGVKWYIDRSYLFDSNTLTIEDELGNYSGTALWGFTGDTITPKYKVKADGLELTTDEYEIVTTESTLSATARNTYTIKVKGKTGSKYDKTQNVATATWKIGNGTIKSAELKNKSDASVTYNKSSQIPAIVVKNAKGKVLTEGSTKDYTIVYKNSAGTVVTEAKDVDTYTAYITGVNDYEQPTQEPLTVTWEITKADLPSDAIQGKTGDKSPTYTGKPQSIVDTTNLPEGATAKYYVVKKAKEVSDVTEIIRDIIVKLFKGTLTFSSSAEGTDAGTYYVVYMIDGGKNYNDRTLSTDNLVTSTIKKADPKVTITKNHAEGSDNLIYAGKDQEQQLISSASADFGTLQFNFRKVKDAEGKADEGEWLEAWTTDYTKLKAVEAGEYEVAYKIEADDNWNAVASTSVYVTIEPKELEDEWVVVTAKLPYTGKDQDAVVVVTDLRTGEVLTKDKDYTLEGDTHATVPKEDGDYEITIKGKGNYKGTIVKEWNIVNLKAVLDYTEFTFDGKLHAVKVSVTKINGDALKEGDDYTVLTSKSTFSATNAGTYHVYVEGKGDYKDAGEIDLTWTIKKCQFDKSDLTILVPVKIWTGKEYSVDPVVTHIHDGNLVVLEKGKDYQFTEDSVLGPVSDAGIYHVTITGVDGGNYEGSVTEEWRVQGIPLDLVATALQQKNFVYDGTAKTPQINIGLIGLLDEGEDYVIEGTRTATTEGTYKIVIKGKGKYYGQKELTWTISKKDVNDCIVVLQNPSYTHLLDSELLSNTETPSVYVYDINEMNDKVKGAIETLAKSDNPVKIAAAKLILDGACELSEKNRQLTADDYELSGDLSAKLKGTYYITITGKGNYTGKVVKDWVISGYTDNVKYYEYRITDAETGRELVYDGKAHKIKVERRFSLTDTNISEWASKLGIDEDKVQAALEQKGIKINLWEPIDLGQVTVSDKNGKTLDEISEINAGTYSIEITALEEPLGESKQMYGTTEVSWTIAPRKVKLGWDKTETVYNGEVQRPKLICIDGTSFVQSDIESKNVVITEAKAISLLPPENAGTYEMYARVEFKDGFYSGNYDIAQSDIEVIGTYIGEKIYDWFIDASARIDSFTDGKIKETVDTLIGKIQQNRYFVTQFKINKRPVGAVWTNDEFTYDGISHLPTATPEKAVAGSDTGLIDGDYCRFTVEGYAKNAGTHTAKVTGFSFVTGLIGNYVLDENGGTLTHDFVIKPKSIADKSVVAIQKLLENLVYNAEVQSPTLSVTDLAITALDKLTEGTDYEIVKEARSEYQATNAGDYTLVIKGINNYTGETTVDWDIEQRSLLDSDVKVSLSSEQLTYNATVQGPEVTVSYKGVQQATDQYSLTGTLEAKDVYDILSLGITDYTIYVHGEGNFKGVVHKDWEIVPLDLGKVDPEVTFVTKVYNGKKQMPETTSVIVGKYSIPLEEVKFTADSAARDAGTHDATLSGHAKLNQYLNYNVVGTHDYTWEILPKEVEKEKLKVKMSTYIYNGKVQRAKAKIYDPETKERLKEGRDYELVAADEEQAVEADNVGTYELTIKFINNYKGSFEEEWTIKQRKVNVIALDAEKLFDPIDPVDPKFEFKTEGTAEGFDIDAKDVHFTREEGEDFGQKYKITMTVDTEKYPNYDINVVNKAYLTINAHKYSVIEGDGQKVKYGTDGSITFRSDGEYKFFTGVKVDGKQLTEGKEFTSWSGSTYVKLKASYVKTLAVGDHTLTFEFMDGSCTANFKIVAGANTGDFTEMLPWIIFAGVVVIALAAIALKRRKAQED